MSDKTFRVMSLFELSTKKNRERQDLMFLGLKKN